MSRQRKRIFISFAIEDKAYRDLLRGQARNEMTPFEFTDMSAKQAWESKWKTQCRIRIRGCDGVIALLSKKTRAAAGARWEMKCAIEEGVPIIGVHTQKDNKGAIPPELKGKRVINWSWNGITNFIDRC